jgi:hypothetical protein
MEQDRQVSYGIGIGGQVMAQEEAGELWHSDRQVSYGTAIGG